MNKGLVGCAIVVGLFSCDKQGSIYEGDRTDEGIKLGEVVVPADFDWKTSDDVKCILNASAPARVEVYTNSECVGSSRIANLYVEDGSEPVKLVLPRGMEAVYMRYMDKTGKYVVKSVAVESGVIEFTLPEGSQNFSTLPVKSSHNDSDLSEIKVEGTALFEDNYPVKGDYDFNDYVMTYEFEAKFDGNKNLKKIEVEMEFVAKGGFLPYEPYLCLRGVKGQLGKEFNIVKDDDDENDGIGLETFKHEGSDNDLILKFTGVAEAMNRMKKEGSEFINTTKGAVTDHFVKFEFDIKFVGNVLNKYEGGDIYDLFLGGEINGEFTEIHTKEFSSTRLVKTNKVEVGGYHTEDNFVWALKISDEYYDNAYGFGNYDVFPYLNEKDDFLKGYPKFKGYIETSGKGAFDWGKRSNRNDKYLIRFKD